MYRIIQEALTNGFKHGNASVITISFYQKGNNIKIDISDNGCGCKNLCYGMGLQGIENRIKSRGGNLTVINNEKGFKLLLEIPIVKEVTQHE